MAQLRLRVASLRSTLRINERLISEADDDEQSKVRLTGKKRSPEEERLSELYKELIDTLPKNYSGGTLDPESEKRYNDALQRFLKGHSEVRVDPTELTPQRLYYAMKGTVHDPMVDRPGKPRKEPPRTRPVTKDYKGGSIQSPLLRPKVPERDLEPDEVKKISPRAFEQIPPGEWHARLRDPYLVLIPVDPTQKILIWSGVPARGQKPELPRAWRSADELTAVQREKLGWLDQRDRGVPTRDTLTQREKPFGDPKNQVRFKGGAEGRVEPEMTGRALGAASGPGGIPTMDAFNDLRRAAIANKIKPDWASMSTPDLKKYYIIAQRHAKTTGMPDDARTVEDIANVIGQRLVGRFTPSIDVNLPPNIDSNDVRDILVAFRSGDAEKGERLLSLLPPGQQDEVRTFLDQLATKNIMKKGDA